MINERELIPCTDTQIDLPVYLQHFKTFFLFLLLRILCLIRCCSPKQRFLCSTASFHFYYYFTSLSLRLTSVRSLHSTKEGEDVSLYCVCPLGAFGDRTHLSSDRFSCTHAKLLPFKKITMHSDFQRHEGQEPSVVSGAQIDSYGQNSKECSDGLPRLTQNQHVLLAALDAETDHYGQNARGISHGTFGRGQPHNQQFLAVPHGGAPRATTQQLPLATSAVPEAYIQSYSADFHPPPSTADLLELGRRCAAYKAALIAYRQYPAGWEGPPVQERFFNLGMRQYLAHMLDPSRRPSPTEMQQSAVMHNEMSRILSNSQTIPARQITMEVTRAQSQGGGNAPHPVNRQLTYGPLPQPAATQLPMPSSGIMPGQQPVPIFPRPGQSRPFNPYTRMNRQVMSSPFAANMQTPSLQHYHVPVVPSTPSIVSNTGANNPVAPAQPLHTHPSISHSPLGHLYQPRDPKFWRETRSLLLPGGDPRFMSLSWMKSFPRFSQPANLNHLTTSAQKQSERPLAQQPPSISNGAPVSSAQKPPEAPNLPEAPNPTEPPFVRRPPWRPPHLSSATQGAQKRSLSSPIVRTTDKRDSAFGGSERSPLKKKTRTRADTESVIESHREPDQDRL